MVQTILLTGVGYGFYAYLPEYDYLFTIADLDYYSAGPTGSYGFGEAGDGFVFQAELGFSTAMYYSDGSTLSIIEEDENGDPIITPHSFLNFAGGSVFRDFYEASLYMTNGDGEVIVLDDSVSDYTLVGDDLYIISQSDIIRIDTDLNQTVVVDYDISGVLIEYVFEFNGDLWVRGREGNTNYFYRYDPDTNTFTEMDVATNDGGDSLYFSANAVGDTLMYGWIYDSNTGLELYVSDGSYGDWNLVEDINPGSSNSYYSVALTETVGDTLFFVANDGGADGDELWVSDGTEAGTFALTGTGTNLGAMTAFSGSTQFFAVGDLLYFTGYSADYGFELFVSDGTVSGTRIVEDFSPGTAYTSVVILGAYDGGVLFSAREFDASALWYSDGTAEGTYELTNPWPDTFTANGAIDYVGFTDLLLENIPVWEQIGDAEENTWLATDLRETFDGLEASDTVSFENIAEAVQAYLDGQANTGGAEGDTLTNIENLIGTSFADILGGDAGDNHLQGSAGNDTLISGDGDDQIEGGAGTDRLVLGVSSSDLTMTEDGDWIVLSSSEGEDSVQGVEVFELADGDFSLDALTDLLVPETITGTSGDDTLAGTSTDDTIVGDDGNDTLTGRAGSDEIEAGTGNDSVAGGIGWDTVDGGSGDDTLNGNDGYDSLSGGEGNDSMTGNNGFDTIEGGEGEDTIEGGLGQDSLSGDEGNDLISGAEGADTLNGGSGDDTLNGNAGADTLNGGDDMDVLNGGINFDYLSGDGGDDTLNGNNGGDTLLGGEGDDRLEGNAGSDSLNGEAGNDVLRGGIGADTFVFEAGSGDDRISDFQNSIDTIEIDADLLSEASPVTDDLRDYASFDGSGDLVFTFVTGDTLTFTGVTSTGTVLDEIVFI